MRFRKCMSLATAVALSACDEKGARTAAPATEVTAKRVGEAPREDPAAKAWAAAPEYVARLLAQDVTEPKLQRPGVELVRVKALHDGEWIAFRLEWDDATRDVQPIEGRFGDMAAVQLPAAPGGEVPSAYMGEPGRAVHIALFRAARAAGADPLEAWPHRRVDLYPWDAAPPAARAAESLRYAPARAAGNPVSDGRAVEDLIAEGFGTLAARAEQRCEGRGAWADGRWTAVIARPIAETPSLATGRRSYAAFAVWDGGAGHAGAKKMRSNWGPLSLEELR